MLQRIIKNSFSNLRSFTNLQQMNACLAHQKHPMTVVYFRASWNPNCLQSDKEVQKFAANNAHLNVIKIDSDAAPKIARHYSVKYEPQFVFCLYGDQVVRQIGSDYQKLQEKNEKMTKLSQDPSLLGINDKWVPYGLKYRALYDRLIKAQYQANVSDI